MRVKNGYGRASAAVFGFIIFLFCFLPEKIALGGMLNPARLH
jgi:hypothetical protein